MAISAQMYGKAPIAFASGGVNWASDPIKVLLMKQTYAFNKDVDQFYSAISAQELATGGNYTVGGAALTGLATTYDGASDTTNLGANNITWASATFSAYYAVIYKNTGTASTSPLLGYVDFGGAQSPAGVDFTIAWSGGVVLKCAT